MYRCRCRDCGSPYCDAIETREGQDGVATTDAADELNVLRELYDAAVRELAGSTASCRKDGERCESTGSR
jgi:hypothetical protein